MAARAVLNAMDEAAAHALRRRRRPLDLSHAMATVPVSMGGLRIA
jgi:hypothetical protein